MNLNGFINGKPMLEPPLLIEDLSPLPPNQVGLAVLGAPIKHSISPQIHSAALRELSSGIPSFLNWVYHKVEVSSKDLASGLEHLNECGYRGLNLTIPHKVDVFSMIDSIDQEARTIGAVNTLFHTGEEWRGFNTDGYGLEQALKGRLGVHLESANILILGAGGAARAAAAQSLSRGCENLWISNRSTERLENMIDALGNSLDTARVVACPISQLPAGVLDCGDLVIINATSLGLNPGDPSPVSLRAFPPSTRVYDMIYNPAETPLLEEARARGMVCENGLSMLVHQAARSLEIWTGQEISVEAMFSGAQTALNC